MMCMLMRGTEHQRQRSVHSLDTARSPHTYSIHLHSLLEYIWWVIVRSAIVLFTRVCQNSLVCVCVCIACNSFEVNRISEDIALVIFRRSTRSKQKLAFFANKKYFWSFFFWFTGFFFHFFLCFRFHSLRIHRFYLEMLLKFVLLSGLLVICSAQRVIYDFFFLNTY